VKYTCSMETVQQNGRFKLFLVNSTLKYILFSLHFKQKHKLVLNFNIPHSHGPNKEYNVKFFQIIILRIPASQESCGETVLSYHSSPAAVSLHIFNVLIC